MMATQLAIFDFSNGSNTTKTVCFKIDPFERNSIQSALISYNSQIICLTSMKNEHTGICSCDNPNIR